MFIKDKITFLYVRTNSGRNKRYRCALGIPFWGVSGGSTTAYVVNNSGNEYAYSMCTFADYDYAIMPLLVQ